MTVSVLSTAHTICELRGWNVSNLSLQKIIYLAHMYVLGQTREPLIFEPFEAWDFGPVVPALYHQVKGFGREAVRNVFHWFPPINKTDPLYRFVSEVEHGTRAMSPGQLVQETHRPSGAWSTYYRAGMRGIVIPNQAILDEYLERTSPRTGPQ